MNYFRSFVSETKSICRTDVMHMPWKNMCSMRSLRMGPERHSA